MIRKIIFSFIFILFSINIYSYINISSCQTIIYSGEYRLNQSLINLTNNCLTITSHDVIFNCQNNNISLDSGFHKYGIGTSNGINFYNNISILNCNIYNFYSGISTYKNSNINIYNNNFYDGNYGLFIGETTNSTFTSNTFQNNSNSIYLSSSSNNTFTSNLINHSNQNGIHLSTSSNNLFNYNNITNAKTLSIYIASTSNYNEFNSNIVTNSSNIGFLISQSTNNDLKSNNIYNNLDLGISIISSSHNTNISSNNIYNSSETGISVSSSSNYNSISLNNITNNQRGIILEYTTNNTIFKNIIINNIYDNIYFFTVSGLYHNLIYDNYLGNISKISSNDWSNFNTQFNLSTQGNRYLNNSISTPFCFAANNCDYFATISMFPTVIISDSVSISSLPSFGTWAIIVSIFIILMSI
jgi:parallel beta-helix repeat protein